MRSYNDGTTPTGIGMPPIGALAYYDSLGGLIPCKIVAHHPRVDYSGPEVSARLTGTRGAWKRGETVRGLPRWFVPRNAIKKTRLGQLRIRSYVWPDYCRHCGAAHASHQCMALENLAKA